MGKFAGFLKRAKKFAGFGLDILNKVNNVYKGVKPFIKDTIDIIPYGNYINKGLDIGSNILDKITPLSSKLLDENDISKSKKLSDKVGDYLGKGTQYGLNKLLDTQEDKGITLEGLFGTPLN